LNGTPRLANALQGMAAEECQFTSGEARATAELQAYIDSFSTEQDAGIDLRRPLVKNTAQGALRSKASIKAGLRSIEAEAGVRPFFLNHQSRMPACLADPAVQTALQGDYGVPVLAYGRATNTDPAQKRWRELEAELQRYAGPLLRSLPGGLPPPQVAAVPQVFLSYCHEKEERVWFNRTVRHLKGLEQAGKIKLWTDQLIYVGRDWDKEIHRAMNSQFAVLLITPGFMASPYIQEKELPHLIQRAEDAQTHVIPVLAIDCTFDVVPWLKAHQILAGAKPLADMGRKANSALKTLCEKILKPPTP
jgi:hypothetical protein